MVRRVGITVKDMWMAKHSMEKLMQDIKRQSWLEGGAAERALLAPADGAAGGEGHHQGAVVLPTTFEVEAALVHCTPTSHGLNVKRKLRTGRDLQHKSLVADSDLSRDYDPTENFAAALVTDFSLLQETFMYGEIERTQREKAAKERLRKAATAIQSCVRMWLARRRFLRHYRRLGEQLAQLEVFWFIQAATMIQSVIRMYMVRKLYAPRCVVLRQEHFDQQQNSQQQQALIGGPPVPLTMQCPSDIVMLPHFVCNGLRALICKNYEDAVLLLTQTTSIAETAPPPTKDSKSRFGSG